MKKTAKTNPFILPKKITSDAIEEEYDREEFMQSIADLPVGNVSETTRTLHHELKRLNHLDMTPLERYEAIQLMLPALGLMLEKMRAHLATKPIPLSGENKLIAKLHLELLVGIVVAYKTVMSQLHDESFTGHLLHKHTRAEALRRALYFLGEILLYEYSAYSTSPKFVWQEIHGIHHYAVINDLRLKDIDTDSIVGDLAVEDIYKRILLLALADSGGLLRGEIRRINEVLTEWLSEVSMDPIGQNISSYPVFVVDATKDAPPYVANEADVKSVKIGWVLRVDKLNHILEKKLDEFREKSRSRLRPVDLVPATLYSKLKKRWMPAVVAREQRSDGFGAISLTCGLGALHWLFGGWQLQKDVDDQSEKKAEAEDQSMYDKPTLAVEQDEFLINVDAELYAAIAAESEQVDVQDISDLEAQEEVQTELYDAVVEPEENECACMNQSRRGYCLAWSGEGEYRAHVGELVGINSKGDQATDGPWSLGVIRWMQVQSNGLMGFGVELFEGDIQAIQLGCDHANGSLKESVMGFMQKINGRVETLITKPFFYGDKDKLLLTSVDGKIPVAPGEIVECTDAFMRFKAHFDSGLVAVKEDAPKGDSKADELFDNIWDDL